MKAVAAFILWLWNALVAFFRSTRPEPFYLIETVEDLPDAPKSHILYIAGEGEYAWAASMLCPCGCGDQIQLNLLKDASPRWAVFREASGHPSLRPSVWRRKGCRSHFFLRSGRIVWCRPVTYQSQAS
jgi:hypothetical protein